MDIDWKTRVLLIGGVVGAVAGLMAGLLYIREIEETGGDGPQRVKPSNLLPIGLAALGVMRQIASLGKPEED